MVEQATSEAGDVGGGVERGVGEGIGRTVGGDTAATAVTVTGRGEGEPNRKGESGGGLCGMSADRVEKR